MEQLPLPVDIVVDDEAYARTQKRRREVCMAVGHRWLGEKCVRCLDTRGRDLSE